MAMNIILTSSLLEQILKIALESILKKKVKKEKVPILIIKKKRDTQQNSLSEEFIP